MGQVILGFAQKWNITVFFPAFCSYLVGVCWPAGISVARTYFRQLHDFDPMISDAGRWFSTGIFWPISTDLLVDTNMAFLGFPNMNLEHQAVGIQNWMHERFGGMYPNHRLPLEFPRSFPCSPWSSWCDEEYIRKTQLLERLVFVGPEGFFVHQSVSCLFSKIQSYSSRFWPDSEGPPPMVYYHPTVFKITPQKESTVTFDPKIEVNFSCWYFNMKKSYSFFLYF